MKPLAFRHRLRTTLGCRRTFLLLLPRLRLRLRLSLRLLPLLLLLLLLLRLLLLQLLPLLPPLLPPLLLLPLSLSLSLWRCDPFLSILAPEGRARRVRPCLLPPRATRRRATGLAGRPRRLPAAARLERAGRQRSAAAPLRGPPGRCPDDRFE
jgi:hypothetical protein